MFQRFILMVLGQTYQQILMGIQQPILWLLVLVAVALEIMAKAVVAVVAQVVY
jgi:hypothetical protein